MPERMVKGVAYDTPVPGYRVPTTNLLRLWKAEATESFDFEAFNVGDYYGAVDEKVASETISKVLYPNDEPEAGKKLRLEQQYFFVSCSLQDMIRLHLMRGKRLDEFDAYWAAQLNDTHPVHRRRRADAAARRRARAWTGTRRGQITQRTCGYTNHTLLAEALEKWPLPLFGALLPRHLEIIYEINRRFLDDVRRRYPGDDELLARLSLIDETGDAIRAHGPPRRASAATPSTASRRCTPSCSSRRCSATSARSRRRSSSTSPTASRRGAGWC